MLFLVAIAAVVASCSAPTGELVGASKAGEFQEANPYGMVFIRRGSFMMGANTQSAVFEQPDNIMMATVEAFWMDETEITNNEYKQFVYWVRDSIAMTHLVNAGVLDYAIQPKEEDFDEENFTLNWKMRNKIPWDTKDEELADALAPMLYSNGELRTNYLHYRYQWYNYDQAVLQRNKFDVATSTYPDGASV
ncbi:MAG: SUMF1/EgtB/PvdO family nonheme iron enzyme, partial [Paludibacteraceae bacterium]